MTRERRARASASSTSPSSCSPSTATRGSACSRSPTAWACTRARCSTTSRRKEELAREVYRGLAERLRKRLEPILAEDRRRASSRMLAALDASVDHFAAEPAAGRLLMRLMVTSRNAAPGEGPFAASPGQADAIDEVLTLVGQWLARARAAGVIRHVPVRHTVLNLMGLVLFYPAVVHHIPVAVLRRRSALAGDAGLAQARAARVPARGAGAALSGAARTGHRERTPRRDARGAPDRDRSRGAGRPRPGRPALAPLPGARVARAAGARGRGRSGLAARAAGGRAGGHAGPLRQPRLARHPVRARRRSASGAGARRARRALGAGRARRCAFGAPLPAVREPASAASPGSRAPSPAARTAST